MTPHPGSSPYAARLHELRRGVQSQALDAMLVSDPHDVYYLTGFESTWALALVDRRAALLITDGRYVEAARRQLRGWKVLCVPAREQEAWWRALWKKQGYAVVGFQGSASWNQARAWRRMARPTRFQEAGATLLHLRVCKDAFEQKALRKSARIADELMRRALGLLRTGLTEREFSRGIRQTAEELGAEGESFPNIVAFGPNTSYPHHHPGARRLRPGDAVLIDLGVRWKGYCSDITRTVAWKSASPRMRKLYALCLDVQCETLRAVRPGMRCAELDELTRSLLAREKLDGYFTHGLGHGVGLDIHEAPTLNPRSAEVLAEGMAVTIEPGIYLPGQLGIRIEDLVLVGPRDARLLSRFPKDLMILG